MSLRKQIGTKVNAQAVSDAAMKYADSAVKAALNSAKAAEAMSTISIHGMRKRGSTNDPVSSRRRRCHRHCHHCCNWRDPWHRTLALARDLSARQLILAPHTIAFAKPLNLGAGKPEPY
jgi:hypothetical protein